jgi:predicted ester cyclase
MEETSLTLAPDTKARIPGGELPHREAFRGWMQSFFDAFPDIGHSHGPLEVDGDRVTTQLRITGTQTAPLVTPQGEIPATGRRVDFPAQNSMVVREDLIRELRIEFDQQDFMRQLGLA